MTAIKAALAEMKLPQELYEPMERSLMWNSFFGSLGAAFLYLDGLNFQDMAANFGSGPSGVGEALIAAGGGSGVT